jgi:hypothetical protein
VIAEPGSRKAYPSPTSSEQLHVRYWRRAATRALMKHSKTKGELDEPTYNVCYDGVSSNILLLTWIESSGTAAQP